MNKNLKNIFKHLLFFTFAFIVFGLSIIIWLKTTSPSLSVFNSYIHQALDKSEYKIEFKNINFSWINTQIIPGIKINDIKIYNKSNVLIALCPEVLLNLKIRDMVKGKIKPVKIEILSPKLNLFAFKSSQFKSNIDKTKYEKNSDQIKENLVFIQKFLSRFKEFKNAHIKNAVIINKNIIKIPDFKIRFDHGLTKKNIEISGKYFFNNKQTSLDGKIKFLQDDSLVINLQINEFYPEFLADFFPKLSFLKGFYIPFKTKIDAYFDSSGNIEIENIELNTKEGIISDSQIWEKPLSVKKIKVKAYITDNLSQLNLKSFLLDFGSPVLKASGYMKNFISCPEIAIDINADHLKLTKVHEYWPLNLENHVRLWIKHNFYSGYINNASLKLRIKPDDLEADILPKDTIQAFVPFNNITLNYYFPMEKVHKVQGLAKFSAHDIDIDVTGAKVYDSKITKGKVHISGLADQLAKISIKADVYGPSDDLRKALNILTNNKTIPINISQGISKTQLGFNFPLHNFQTKDFQYSAFSEINNMKISDFYGCSIFQEKVFIKFVQNEIAVSGSDWNCANKNFWDKPVFIKNIESKFRLQYDPDAVIVKSFYSDLDGTIIKASGHIKQGKVSPDIDLNIDVDKLEIKKACQYWPLNLADTVRNWIKNHFQSGQINKAKIRLNLEPENFIQGKLLQNAIEAIVPFDNVSCDYYSPLPILHKAKGIAKFNTNSIEINVDSGQIDSSNLDNTEVKILIDKIPQIEVQAFINGPLDDILNAEHALFNQYKGPEMKADAESVFNLNFPLTSNFANEQIKFSAFSQIKNLTLSDFYGFNLVDGTFKAEFKDHKISASGTIWSGRTKIYADIYSPYSDEYAQTIKLSSQINSENISDLGLPDLPFFHGKADAKANIKLASSETFVDTSFDFQNMQIDLNSLGWTKKTGETGFLKAEMKFEKDKIDFSNLHFYGHNFNASGLGLFEFNNYFKLYLNFKHLQFGRNDLSLQFGLKNKEYDIDIKGSVFDLMPVIQNMNTRLTAQKPKENLLKKISNSSIFKGHIIASLDKVLLMNDINLNNVNGAVRCKGFDLVSGGIKGSWNNKEQVNLKLSPDKDKNHLVINTQNAGSLLKGLDITSNFIGGNLNFNADFKKSVSEKSVQGILKIDKFTLVSIPLLVKIVSMASFIGILEQLQTRGIAFDTFETNLAYYDNKVRLKNARMEGLSMGLTADGYIDIKNRLVDLQGLVVPLNIVNKMLDAIPVVGKLIVGDGIIATNYSVKGAYKNPEVKIKPMSTLAVGSLRNFFKNIKLKNISDLPDKNEYIQQEHK